MIRQYTRTSFLSHPLAMVKFLAGNKTELHNVMLLDSARYLLGKRYDRSFCKQVIDEISAGDFVPMNTVPGVQLPGNKPQHLFGKFLYFIVRCTQPEIMVETGVAHGVSSWTILNAIHRNGGGKLYSIDLPNLDLKSYNPQNISQSSGWVVPDKLRQYWELQLGSSSELLPKLVHRLDKIDVFFHDSDHSYENMTFEFTTVFPKLHSGSLIISDDVHKNASFTDFVNQKGIRGLQFLTKGGAASV